MENTSNYIIYFIKTEIKKSLTDLKKFQIDYPIIIAI